MTIPGADALTIILLALMGDALIAGLPGIRQIVGAPVAFMAALARWLEARLNRPQRSASNRKFRGAIATVFMIGLALGVGTLFENLFAEMARGWMWTLLIAMTMLTQRRGIDAAWNIRRCLNGGDLDGARILSGPEIRHDPSHDDAHGLARGAIEISAMRFCDGAVAPAFWYIVLGLPGLMVFRVINAMAFGLGDKSGPFGLTAARLDGVLNILPAPICGLIFSVSAVFAPAANPLQAFNTMQAAIQGRAASPRPWVVGAMAGALGLALGGPRRADGAEDADGWIGDGRARAAPTDIGRAIFVAVVAWVIAVGALGFLALASAGFW
jgi:adenosylcobinamide-phosphate synthase